MGAPAASGAASAPTPDQLTPVTVTGFDRAAAEQMAADAASANAGATARVPIEPTRVMPQRPSTGAGPSAGASSYTRTAYNGAAEAARRAPVASPRPDPEEPPRKKKGHGKVIAVVVLILVLAGAAAGGVWYVMSQQQAALQQQIDDLSARQDGDKDEESQNGSADSSDSGSGSSASDSGSASGNGSGASSAAGSGTGAAADYGAYGNYVGTWTGEMQKTDSTGFGRVSVVKCYGAEGHPISINIKEIQSTGRMSLSVSYLYHGHSVTDLSSDLSSADGDSYLTFDDLTTTFDAQEGYSVTVEPDGADTETTIKVVPMESTDDKERFEVTVTSKYSSGTAVIDTYYVSKTS